MDPEPLIPTRQTLLSRLKRWSDQESWQAFFDAYWKLIYKVCLRYGLDEQDAQDVVQETVVTVAKRISKFEYQPQRASFKTWLYEITKSRIIDHLRKQKRRQGGKENTIHGNVDSRLLDDHVREESCDHERIWLEEWQKNLIDQAITRVRRKVRPKQYQIYDLYVVKERQISEIIHALGVNRAQIYLAKHRVGDLIRKEIEELEAEADRPQSFHFRSSS